MKLVLSILWMGCLAWGWVNASAVAGQEVIVVQQPAGSPAGPDPFEVPPGPGSVPVVIGPDGKPHLPGQPVPGTAPASRAARPTGAAAPPGGAPGAKPDPSDSAKDKTVVRPDKPTLPPDPRELKVQPDTTGKIHFNFHGQPWADVLEWLAAISAMSLDWQELPGDYLNLVTRRAYTVPEARDLINRHLLARGFTLLQNGEVLSVAKLDKLNPGLVPRVEPEELDQRLPHEYVKVSFALDWILSEKAVEELKPMLSPSHKITPLKNTNRIEVMDAVINLREIYSLIRREQSDEPQQRLVQEFPLEFTRAAEVLEQLKSLLGVDSKPATNAPMSRQQMEAMQQQQMMMMQQMQQQQGRPPTPSAKPQEGTLYLVANTRRNSILAHAPPDKMEIISQAIKTIDVESDQSHSLVTNANRMQVYRLQSVDPETLVKTLLQIGQLEPSTHLEPDAKNRAIIAYASLTDHLTIRQVVERLDGSGRKFEVMSLRRLDADYVAGTIEFMMLGPQNDKQSQSRVYVDYFSPYSRSGGETKSEDKFRVDADIENNRLLLWANDLELQEVTNLLIKLGEIPSRGDSNQNVRILDVFAPEEMQLLLERLQRAWPAVAPNPLTLPPVPGDNPPSTPTEGPQFDSFERPAGTATAPLRQDSRPATVNGTDELSPPPLPSPERPAARALNAKTVSTDDVRTDNVTADDVTADVDETAAEPDAEEPLLPPSPADSSAGRSGTGLPPVSMSISPDGRVILFSQDSQALDLLEELIRQVAPARRDYRIYRLKHADSFWVRKNLEAFFVEEDDAKGGRNSSPFYFDYYAPPASEDKPRSRLSQRRKLKFIDDLDTNSILVQGADAGQLRTIEDLIRTYDRPQESDSSAARVSMVIPIRYSKALTIATAVKDVYRDLLSSNDKALASSNPEQKNRIPSGAATFILGDSGTGGEDKERTRVTFKGKLSIGVDDVTNTLLVSAEGENLMHNVTDMVHSLDDAAKPLSTVSVVQLSGNSNAARVQEVLKRLLIESKPAAAPPVPQSRMLPGQTPGAVIGAPGDAAVPAEAAGP